MNDFGDYGDGTSAKPIYPHWGCPRCPLRVGLLGGSGTVWGHISPSIASFIRQHCTAHGMDVTEIKAELDRLIRSITL